MRPNPARAKLPSHGGAGRDDQGQKSQQVCNPPWRSTAIRSLDKVLTCDSAREAIHSLLGNINSRNPNQSLLALAVLDHLVKNGGYPIHLQISTKEFLNELVRRFPERPPMVTGRVMGRILEVCHHSWRVE